MPDYYLRQLYEASRLYCLVLTASQRGKCLSLSRHVKKFLCCWEAASLPGAVRLFTLIHRNSPLLWTLSSSLLPRVQPSHRCLTSSFLLSSLPLFPSPIRSFRKKEGEKLQRCRGKWWWVSGSGAASIPMFPSTPPSVNGDVFTAPLCVMCNPGLINYFPLNASYEPPWFRHPSASVFSGTLGTTWTHTEISTRQKYT